MKRSVDRSHPNKIDKENISMFTLKKLAMPVLAVGFAAIALGQYQLPGQAPPQRPPKTEKASAERPVSGFVTDADGKPVVGAVVQLKNTRTLQVRSFITRDKGDYYFSGLSKDVDYELKAEFGGKSSPSRTLSSFDTKAEPTINLQIK
jgi:hypothetical protein